MIRAITHTLTTMRRILVVRDAAFREVLLMCILVAAGYGSFSQVSSPTPPRSFEGLALDAPVAAVKMAAVDTWKLALEDAGKEETQPARFGYPLRVDLGLDNSGVWTELPEGGRIWRLRIVSAGARSLNLIYRDFFLPHGSTFHLYDPLGSQVLGAFTSANNRASRSFATGIVRGDSCVLEYFEPSGSQREGSIRVSRVVHGYRGFGGGLQKDFGDSLSCGRNVNCPEGSQWQDEKRSVGLLLVWNNSRSCSGVLLNNVREDGKPYFLTSRHCVSPLANPDNWMVMFNYESPDCSIQDGNTNQTLLGLKRLASSTGNDFQLFELYTTPPTSYNLRYAGWSREGVAPSRTVSIHHPEGDVKKISVDYHPAQYHFGATNWGPTWRVKFEVGKIESGSSGAPLFDQNSRVVGIARGGTLTACDVPGSVTYYSCFFELWDQGDDKTGRLKDWLDPDDTGVMVLDGMYLEDREGDFPAPGRPHPPSFSGINSSSVTISWRAPEMGDSRITEYVVERSPGGDGSFATVFSGSTALTFTDTGLALGTDYYYRVQAVNSASSSEFSQAELVTPVGAPITMQDGGSVVGCNRLFLDPGGTGDYSASLNIGFTLLPASDTERVRVNFSSFEVEIEDYLEIYHGPTPGDQSRSIDFYKGSHVPPVIASESSDGALSFLFVSDDLVQLSGWEVGVACIPFAAPLAPEPPLFGTVLSDRIGIYWREPVTRGFPVTGYVVEGKATGEEDFTTLSSGSADRSYLFDSDVEADQTYSIRVRALSDGGSSPFSEVSMVTAQDIRVRMSTDEIETCGPVGFTDSGGLGLYGNSEDHVLTVSPSVAGKRMLVTFSHFGTERDLDRLTIYDGGGVRTSLSVLSATGFRALPSVISASSDGKLTFHFKSDVGSPFFTFGWQGVLECTDIVPTVPTAPTITSVETQHERVTIGWAPPSGGGGATILHYEVRVDGITDWIRLPFNSRSYTRRGLTNGSPQAFQVRAVSSLGTGTFSEVVATPQEGVPGPAYLYYPLVGDFQVTLRWDSSEDGGHSILRYEYKIDEGGWEPIASTVEGNVHVVGDLTANVAYSFQIRAVNSLGAGTPSNVETVTPTAPPAVFSTSIPRGGTLDLGRFSVGDVSDLSRSLRIEGAHLTGDVTASITAGGGDFSLAGDAFSPMVTLVASPTGSLAHSLVVFYRGRTDVISVARGTLDIISEAIPPDFADYRVELLRTTEYTAEITVSPTELDMGSVMQGQQGVGSLGVRAFGFGVGDSILVEVETDSSPFSATPSSLQIGADARWEDFSLAVTFAPGITTPLGIHNGSILLTAESSLAVRVEVTATVTGRPVLVVSQGRGITLDFGTVSPGTLVMAERVIRISAENLTAGVQASVAQEGIYFGLGLNEQDTPVQDLHLPWSEGSLPERLLVYYLEVGQANEGVQATLTLRSEASEEKDFEDYVIPLSARTKSPPGRGILVDPPDVLDLGEVGGGATVTGTFTVRLSEFDAMDVVTMRVTDSRFTLDTYSVITQEALMSSGQQVLVTLDLPEGISAGMVTGSVEFSWLPDPSLNRSLRVLAEVTPGSLGVSTGEALSGSQFRIYPNPADAYLRFEGDGSLRQVEVYSPGGFLSATMAVEDGRMNTSGLESGLWLLRLQAGGKARMMKLWVVH